MILKEILSEMKTAQKPVWKKLQEGKDFHVLAIGLAENVHLHEHKSDIPAKIVVVQGEISYVAGEKKTRLSLFDEHVIPVGEYHSVEAHKDSLFLVIKG